MSTVTARKMITISVPGRDCNDCGGEGSNNGRRCLRCGGSGEDPLAPTTWHRVPAPQARDADASTEDKSKMKYPGKRLVTLFDPVEQRAAAVAFGTRSWTVVEIAAADAPLTLLRRALVALGAQMGPRGARAVAEWACIVAAESASESIALGGTRSRECALRASEFAALTMRASIEGVPGVVALHARRAAEAAADLSDEEADRDATARRHLFDLAERLELIPPTLTSALALVDGGSGFGFEEAAPFISELARADRRSLTVWAREIAALIGSLRGAGPQAVRAAEAVRAIEDLGAALGGNPTPSIRVAELCFKELLSALEVSCPYTEPTRSHGYLVTVISAELARLHRYCVGARRAARGPAVAAPEGSAP